MRQHLSRRRPACAVEKTRSDLRIVHSEIDVKSWMHAPPTCEAARPGRCPACGAASRPAGKRLVLVGHGLRERNVLGPRALDDASEIRSVGVRRYRCRRCDAIATVVPRGVVRRHAYGAVAIVLALGKWAVEERPAREVRGEVSPFGIVGATAAIGWASLGRWSRSASRMFAGLASPTECTRRELALPGLRPRLEPHPETRLPPASYFA